MKIQVADGALLRVAARLLDMFNQEFAEPTPGPEVLAARLAHLVEAGDTSILVALDDAGDGAGVSVLRLRGALWSPDLEAYLAELFVVPERRRSGIGGRLLQATLDHARQRGASYIDLTTTEDDVAARHLYEKFGFVRTWGRTDGPLSFYYEREL